MGGAVVHHVRWGRPVRLEGLGIYSPQLTLDGTIKIAHRTDAYIKRAINQPGAFKGEILNRQNIGRSLDDLIAQWNQEHPDDPIG